MWSPAEASRSQVAPNPGTRRRIACCSRTGGELMISRRTFLSLVAASMSVPRAAFAQTETRKVALYANVGADLTHYDVDVGGKTMFRMGMVQL